MCIRDSNVLAGLDATSSITASLLNVTSKSTRVLDWGRNWLRVRYGSNTLIEENWRAGGRPRALSTPVDRSDLAHDIVTGAKVEWA